MQVNTLLKPTWIIPIVPEGVVLTKHVIAIADGKIAAIVPESEASQFEAKEVVELPGEIVMPGFVNLHSHAAMNLLRGVGPDLSLMDWLQKKVWPLEGRLMSRNSCTKQPPRRRGNGAERRHLHERPLLLPGGRRGGASRERHEVRGLRVPYRFPLRLGEN